MTYPVQEFGVSNISMWAMTLEKSDLQIGVGTIGIFDPAIYSIEYAYVGCFFDSWTDDYFVPDPGPCEKFSVYAYNSYLHSWNSFHETIDSHGAMYKGIFHAILHHAPFHNHFGYYDEFLNEWKRDTLDHELNGIIRIKDRIITFVDSTTAGTKVHFRTYDFNSHSFIKIQLMHHWFRTCPFKMVLFNGMTPPVPISEAITIRLAGELPNYNCASILFDRFVCSNRLTNYSCPRLHYRNR
ncbi:MAG: hypothetical protein IPN54_00655 [Bacteroidetes bacterium]|nr:hypothetical protein [Bacteroidota bacterium]